MEELIKKTETMLRAVLISSPRGVPLYRLDKEYRSITFEPIPYEKCGFKTVEDFIRRIPKVAKIETDRDGDTIVKGVPSEADQHVAKLIAKQKKPKLKKSASRPARRPMASYLRFSSPAKFSTSKFGPRKIKTATKTVAPVVKQLPPTSGSISTGLSSRPQHGTPRFVPPRLAKKALNDMSTTNIQVSSGLHRKVTLVSQKDASGSKRTVTFPLQRAADEKPAQLAKSSVERTVKPKGINFSGMEINISRTPPQSPVAKEHMTDNELSLEVLERIGNIAGNNVNGFFLKRLPVVYKEKYQQDLPSNIPQLLSKYPNIVHVEQLGHIYIAYPPKIKGAQPEQAASNRPEETKQNPVSHYEEQAEIKSQQKVIELYSITPYRVPALGVPVQVYISHIESVNHFYVQYKEHETYLDALQQRLSMDMKDSLDCISTPVQGMHCCAQFTQDNSWYRGQVLECVQENDTKTVHIFYVDFGNAEWLPYTRLRYLKQEHVELPKIAVLCSLWGISLDDKIAKEKLVSMLDQECTMTVYERIGEVLYVKIAGEDGVTITTTQNQLNLQPQKELPVGQQLQSESKHQIQEPAEQLSQSSELKKPVKSFLVKKSVSVEQERKSPETVVIPDSEFIDIMVSSVFSTDNISVMLYGEEHSDKLLALEISMMSYFVESSEDIMPPASIGELYAIKSSELHSEDQYYRVKVLSINGDQAMLEFVDYGDTRKAPLSGLQRLPARFLELPLQAFTISLHGIPKTKKPQVLDKLKHYLLGKALVAEVFQRTHDKLDVEIFDTSTEQDININDVIRSLIIPDEDLVPALPKGNHQVEARISHISNTGSVFVQIPGAGLNRLEELMTDITEHYSKSTKAAEFVSHPTVGHICCVKCTDGAWYRAVILEQMHDRKVKVQCVDYGNIEVLARTALREPTTANEHVNLLPFQAKECLLHGIEKDSWNEEKAAKMNELISEDVILEVTKHDTIPTVKIYLTTEDDQQINIVDYVLDEVSASKSDSSLGSADFEQADKESSSQDDDQDDSSPDLPPPITLTRPWVDVTISDVIDPGHFMFQPLEMLKQLEDLNDKMTEHYKASNEADHVISPRNGDICAVRYSDGHFYRAVVKAVLSPQQICVLFIDYGNLGIHSSNDLRVLADEYKQMSAIAVKGSLAGVHAVENSAGEWPDNAKKRFEELTLWKMLVASVDGHQYHYDFREDLKVPIHLYDTSVNNDDLNIADVLINEGFARKQ